MSLCGETTFETPIVLSLTMPSFTLCCETHDCIVENSSGSMQRSLYISIPNDDSMRSTVRNLTVANVVFRNGKRPTQGDYESSRGGNVCIEISREISGMTVLLEDCVLDRGVAQEGGNLYIDNTFGSIVLRRCTLSNGTSVFSAGGAYLNAEEIVLDGTRFVNNTVPIYDNGVGGGLVTDYKHFTISQEISVFNSTFFQNLAPGAGAVFASSFGTSSSLRIQQTTFEENRAVCPNNVEDGASDCGTGFSGFGAVAMIFPTETSRFGFCENKSTGNTADFFCDGILFEDTNPGQCIAIEDNFP